MKKSQITNYKLLSGKDLGHCMKKLMGKHTAEAFQPLCMYHADILYLCQFWVCSDLYMDGFISLISFQHQAPGKCGHQQAITNCLESQTTGSLTQLTNDQLFWRFLWLFCCASPPHLIVIPGAQNQKWKTHYISLKEILCAVFILDEPSAFYAEELFEATEGLGTNDEKLQRIFVLRAEVVEWIFNFEISSGGLEKRRPCV